MESISQETRVTRIHTIIGQCKNASTDTCLHLAVRNHKLYLGFFNDDLSGNTNLTELKWYHVAFVFDDDTRNQSVYLDGIIDGSRQANTSFQGYNQSLTFGSTDASGTISCFDGLIDQLSFTESSQKFYRNPAGCHFVVVYFLFDNNSTYDEGPLRINGSLVGNTSLVPGRVGQALEIKNVNQSDFALHGLVLLGISKSIIFILDLDPAGCSTEIYDSSPFKPYGWCWLVCSSTRTDHIQVN